MNPETTLVPVESAPAAAPAAESAPAGPSKEEQYRGHLQRLQAEFDNYRKRVQRERQETADRAKGDVIARFLGVLDNLERALAVPALAPEVAAGLELVRREFLGLLAAEQVTAVETLGKPFDPRTSEALEQRPSAEPEGTVLAEHRKGYRHRERLLRPAQVAVSRGPAA